MAISNEQIRQHAFLAGMYSDAHFPKALVAKGEAILQRLCERIEAEKPDNLGALYVLTHEATEEFNRLAEEFFDAESEFETVAREFTAMDFDFIARAYGFDADMEELIAPRDW